MTEPADDAPVDPWYAFAEPCDGYFIPRPPDRARALGILDQAAQWYGGAFKVGPPPDPDPDQL